MSEKNETKLGDMTIVPIEEPKPRSENGDNQAELNTVVGEMENLAEALEENTRHVARDNSFHNRFWIGVAQGFGAVVGATVVVAIFVYILRSLSHYGILTSLNDWIVDLLSKGR